MSSLNVLDVEQCAKINSLMSFTPLVSQSLMWPCVASAAVGSLHQSVKAVRRVDDVRGSASSRPGRRREIKRGK